MSASTSHRLALGLVAATVVLLVLASGALGIVGAGGRPDRGYAAVVAVLAIGALAARLRPSGMAIVLAATALTQVLVTVTVFATGLHRTQGASVTDVVMVNALFVGLFALSAWLFRRSAEQRSSTGAASSDRTGGTR